MTKGANWIGGLQKGGLHKSLGIPAGKKIPEVKIEKAAHKGGKIGKQAHAAETLEGLRPKAPKPVFKANKPAPMLGSTKNVGHKAAMPMPVSTDRGNFKIK